MDSWARSLAKTLSWRLCAAVVTTGVCWAVTGTFYVAATIGLLDTLIKLGAYYFHERAWNRISFGKKKTPDYEI